VEWSLCPKLLSFTNAARLLFLFQLFPLIVTQDAFLAQTGEFFVLPILGELMLQDQEFSQPKLLEAAPSHESLLSHHFCKIEKTPFPVDRFEPAAPALQCSDSILMMSLFPSILLPRDLNANHTRH
jgi:hypothetical protein